MNSKLNVVVLDGYTLNPGDLSWDNLEKICNLKVYDKTMPEEVSARAKEADAVLTNKVVFSKEVIASLPKLKYIGVLATGYNVVDISAASSRGICVTNIPSYSTESVAQAVFAFIFNFYWHIQEHSDEVLKGKWTACEHFCYHSFPLHELSFKTVGIIGFGNIGQAVAKIALAMNMNVVYVNRSEKKIKGLEGARQVNLTELLELSDIISLNCPLTDETKNILNGEALKKVKPNVYIVNTGRGPLADEKAVAQALKEKRIAGYASDVLSIEPPSKDNPLLSAPNCTITPHIAWQTLEARSRLMEIAVNNLSAFIEGKPVNRVNTGL
ncbi:D-2-hydroxyacid dehydrogenase [Treponema pedis]|uniref:D-2-hydroxyacid dehydrogenase n=1 Tax=Treponema pedis TaxID=409322 RepID=A0A7S7AXV9_9SPIR|nr:D-2-hydroxyacid dehydrogenase [Treponema pedis]QOW61986.1 D-2-hydroxyacid dehydrogenase [Treponema pedis]